MSVKVMSHIWEHSRQEGGTLLVLLALADFANDEGRAFPSVPTLARKARLTVRHTQRVLQELQAAGEIAVDPQTGPHGCNVYRVNLSPRQIVTPDICDTGGVTSATGGVTWASPEPSEEPSGKPSVAREDARRPLKSQKPAAGRDPLLDNPSVLVYRDVCRLTPNPEQRRRIAAEADDPERWLEVCSAFMVERQPPQRVDWLLERYAKARGSPPAESKEAKQARLKREWEAKGKANVGQNAAR